MKKQLHETDLLLKPHDNNRLRSLYGQADEHIRLIEKELEVDIHVRGNQLRVVGLPKAVKLATRLIDSLYEKTLKQELSIRDIQLGLKALHQKASHQIPVAEPVEIHTRYLKVHPRGQHQVQFLRNIDEYDVNFAIGPAGTGKTFLAVARAVDKLEAKKVERILLVRPVVEAGEHLGFLPGDLSQKIDPYLRPLFDSLYAMLGHVEVNRLIEHHIIEAAPLAYMRGRTLNDSFIILDEAQNTTILQMKMFLTRIGYGSKVVITGDVTQVDLPRHLRSGLNDAVNLLTGVDGICFNYFDSHDIVRHPTVQRIVDAYEQREEDEEDGDSDRY